MDEFTAQECVNYGWDRSEVTALVTDAIKASRIAARRTREALESSAEFEPVALVQMIRALMLSVEKLVRLLRELEDEIDEIERAGAQEILAGLAPDQLRQVMEWLGE